MVAGHLGWFVHRGIAVVGCAELHVAVTAEDGGSCSLTKLANIAIVDGWGCCRSCSKCCCILYNLLVRFSFSFNLLIGSFLGF